MGLSIRKLTHNKEVFITGSLLIVGVWFVFTICVGASLGIAAFKHFSPSFVSNHTIIKPISNDAIEHNYGLDSPLSKQTAEHICRGNFLYNFLPKEPRLKKSIQLTIKHVMGIGRTSTDFSCAVNYVEDIFDDKGNKLASKDKTTFFELGKSPFLLASKIDREDFEKAVKDFSNSRD